MTTLFIVAAYLIGSISSGILVSQAMHLPDPRTQGSKNPGATNVLRSGSKLAAFVTLLGDMLKAIIPIVAAKMYGLPDIFVSLVALAAFVGHLFPVFFHFKGGKGVATLLGALLGLAWPLGLAAIIIWLLVAVIFRYSSLSAISAALLVPILGLWLAPEAYIFAITAMCFLLIVRHYTNIRRLFAGTESKIGSKS